MFCYFRNEGIFFILKGQIDQNVKNAVVCLELEGQLPLQFGISVLQTHPIKFIRVNPVCVSKVPRRQFGAKTKQMYLHLRSVSAVTAQCNIV